MPSPQNIARDRKYRGYVISHELCLESKTLTLFFQGGNTPKRVYKLKQLRKITCKMCKPELTNHQEIVLLHKDTNKETFIVSSATTLDSIFSSLAGTSFFHEVALKKEERYRK